VDSPPTYRPLSPHPRSWQRALTRLPVGSRVIVFQHRRSSSLAHTLTLCSTPIAMPTALPRVFRWIWCVAATAPASAAAAATGVAARS
jgi:hypothetical protein